MNSRRAKYLKRTNTHMALRDPRKCADGPAGTSDYLGMNRLTTDFQLVGVYPQFLFLLRMRSKRMGFQCHGILFYTVYRCIPRTTQCQAMGYILLAPIGVGYGQLTNDGNA